MAQQYQQLMAAPPEWHDGEIVSMTRAEDRAPIRHRWSGRWQVA
jgi:hypothetical protein